MNGTQSINEIIEIVKDIEIQMQEHRETFGDNYNNTIIDYKEYFEEQISFTEKNDSKNAMYKKDIFIHTILKSYLKFKK